MLNAITLNSMAINGTRFIGPAAVAFIIGWHGVGAAYIVSTGMYMLVVMATLRIRLDFVKPLAGSGNMVAQLFEGFRYLAGNRLLLTLVLLGLGPLAIGIAHRSLLPALYRMSWSGRGNAWDSPVRGGRRRRGGSPVSPVPGAASPTAATYCWGPPPYTASPYWRSEARLSCG